VQQNLGVRTAEVVHASLAPRVETVGSVAYDERDLVMVQARSNGFLEKLYVRAPLDPVRKGQPLAQLYVPDWIAAQEEYLSAKRIAAQTEVSGLKTLVDGARQRMRLAGMTDDQIAAVEHGGKVQPRVTITAPIGGVIAELGAREGMTVMPGAPLFKINGLGTVWVNSEVPESMASHVRPGTAVEVRTSAFPGTTFKGRVSAILPEVNMATRTLKARIEVANPGAKLVPGMFATVDLSPAAHREVLAVPSEAVIQTGKRSVVMVAQGEGKFAPVEVEIGMDSNGQTEIRKGLEAGQKVVVSGQFLIDSEANLKATATRMADTALAAAPQTHHAVGVVESVARGEITISHGAIPALEWPAMTMTFALAPGVPAQVVAGDKVAFDIRPKTDGTFEVAKLEPLGAAAAQAAHAEIAKGPGK
jgi:Cu(I)/Ag(I) efflux system membrane fusion protein